MARSLLLHAGMPKAGSSALQVAFVKNRSVLAEHGIDYPEHESDELAVRDRATSGNGMNLVRFLVKGQQSPDENTRRWLDEALQVVRDGHLESTLYSSEFFYESDETPLRVLALACARSEVRLRLILYVRDVAGHALSRYSQEVKRARCTSTFEEYLRGDGEVPYRPGLHARLSMFADVLGGENVLVHHYDSVRDQLVPHFFGEVLGIPESAIEDAVMREVNRSLSSAELEFMRHLNGYVLHQPDAKLASDALVELPAFDAAEPYVTRRELEILERRFASQVRWVRATFEDAARLSIVGDTEVRKARASYELDPSHVHLVRWVARLVSPRSFDEPFVPGA